MDDQYICYDCGYVFDEPKKHREYLEHFGTVADRTWLGCPKCGGEYTEALQCDCCGEFIQDDYITVKNGERYCDACYDKCEM